jgi:hypothetical protein
MTSKKQFEYVYHLLRSDHHWELLSGVACKVITIGVLQCALYAYENRRVGDSLAGDLGLRYHQKYGYEGKYYNELPF